ncbi:transposon, unclassified [Olea europaea subsp. europaea]|uniref:Transposon, unclassified n=1 Tax=Olea europaea subsp. europaea TaxID=158383 RepID=A0A8S0S314_OLEEU|nr:transposon, unclassified [Olea europaea subsp. europaea]
MAEEIHLTEPPVQRPREEAKENGSVSLQMEESNGVAAPAECISTIIPGWFSEISPMWPVIASPATIMASINSIPMLNGTNFETWKENISFVLGCMDLDLSLRKEQPAPLIAESSSNDKSEHERWERSNRLSLMIMKRSIPEALRGAMSDENSAKKFLEEIEKRFAKNKKAEISTLLANLFSMKYKEKGNIREHIMEMSNIASKLNALKLELSEDLLVHLVLISLSAQYSQFIVSYNAQNDK